MPIVLVVPTVLCVGLVEVCPCFRFHFSCLRMVEIRNAAARFDAMSFTLVRQRDAAVVHCR